MKTLFSTTAVHPRDRFDYWHEIACKTIINHDLDPFCRHTFEAKLTMGLLGDIALIMSENSPMKVWHTARHIGRSSADELLICQQTAGSLAIEQNGHQIELKPGELTLIDPQLPYFASFSAGSKMLVLKIPRRLLDARVGYTREMAACSINRLANEAGLTSAFLAMLPTFVGNLSSAAELIVKEQALELIALALAAAMDGRPRISAARSLTRAKVLAAIEAHLTDPALDTKAIAAAAGVSARYANAVLAEENTTVGRAVRARRLARCRRAIEDPCQGHRTISEIAYSWGFSDMSHFGRKFREAFGILPSECRKLAKSKHCKSKSPGRSRGELDERCRSRAR